MKTGSTSQSLAPGVALVRGEHPVRWRPSRDGAQVPRFFLLGEEDAYTMTSEIEAYATEIQALVPRGHQVSVKTTCGLAVRIAGEAVTNWLH
jgi:hypothetical protein